MNQNVCFFKKLKTAQNYIIFFINVSYNQFNINIFDRIIHDFENRQYQCKKDI